MCMCLRLLDNIVVKHVTERKQSKIILIKNVKREKTIHISRYSVTTQMDEGRRKKGNGSRDGKETIEECMGGGCREGGRVDD